VVSAESLNRCEQLTEEKRDRLRVLAEPVESED
jgi:hypothetical protein